jgi:hypothetical protein
MRGSLWLQQYATRADVSVEFNVVTDRQPPDAEEVTRRVPPGDFLISAMSGCALPFHQATKP